MAKKIAPALYSLYSEHKLPYNFKMVGFARRAMSEQDFEKLLTEKLQTRLNLPSIDTNFFKQVTYHQGNFNDPQAFQSLKEHVLGLEKASHEYCKIVFYLAVPQTGYAEITKQIGALGFDKDKISIIYEKPFGLDLSSAESLDKNIKECFTEKHIYRIDHYLGKTIVNNVLDFRIENPMINNIWNPKDITRIEISTLETAGVEDRGEFYETVGAFKDVGENHLLEILALLTADTKDLLSDKRLARANMLGKLQIMSATEIAKNTFRAQYVGYKNIREVEASSKKETYFKIKTHLEDPLWRHVDIILEAGKGLHREDKRFSVFFKNNVITFKLFPDAAIEFCINLKTNGHVTCEKFVYNLKDDKYQYVAEYARLFLEIFQNNQENFISRDEVLAQWRFADAINKAWQADLVPLNFYEKGTTPTTTL